MGLFSRNKPKINLKTPKKDGFSGWVKCTHCHELVHISQLEQNKQCCPKCDCHYRISATRRIELLADEGSFEARFTNLKPTDPLNFIDEEPYAKRIELAQTKSGRDEGAIVGLCTINGSALALGVLDFSFMGGSMGSVVGERLTALIELAIEKALPLVIVSASGGARMQESIYSLMQMAKTSAALALLSEKGLPYISVLTNPTTGGVTASFASLGDIMIAEPDALIGFAGPRVVEQTMRQKLPPNAQRSEFLLEKGMIDCIVSRHDLKETLSFFIQFLTGNENPLVDRALLGKLPERLKEFADLSEKR
jgi:acetyl-CoA carboxylase carboxyl transferase subunit beta